jgi:hypothetical protein
MNESDKERGYKHFLRYFHYNDLWDFKSDFTDLFYDRNESTLFIKRIDHYNNSEKELMHPLQDKIISDQVMLELFLIEFMSYRGNFDDRPLYENSEVFSEQAFEELLQKGISLMNEKDQTAILLNADNELINYCKSIGLNPKPEGSSPTNWVANCLSSAQHHLMISTESNKWGCGYCSRKGDINSLREWYENKNKVV